MIVNLPKMLHEALVRSQTASKKTLEHARALSFHAKSSDNMDERLAVIRAFQIATETQSIHAATVAHVMASIAHTQGPDMAEEDCSTCDNESCPNHGGEKPN